MCSVVYALDLYHMYVQEFITVKKLGLADNHCKAIHMQLAMIQNTLHSQLISSIKGTFIESPNARKVTQAGIVNPFKLNSMEIQGLSSAKLPAVFCGTRTAETIICIRISYIYLRCEEATDTILCTGLPIINNFAGQWLNSSIFHDNIQCIIANDDLW